jgi:predicted nucleic acid-binding protein
MTAKFFDSNIVFYAHDQRDPAKQQLAKDLMELHSADRTLTVSTQVIQEFYTSATRKAGLSRTTARTVVEDLSELNIVTIQLTHILRAMDLERRFQVAFWDALILAAAETCGADVLYTEDLTHGRKYGTVRVVNPFREDRLG